MSINIGGAKIGKNGKVFIIAEISANHLQDYNIAVKTIKAAKEAGADAIKLQTYTADTITLDCNNRYFQIKHGTIWDGTTLYKLYQTAYTPWEWQPKLKRLAEKLGLIFFSSPFDITAVDFLEKMGVPAYKVASFEITDIPLIEYIASKNKPIIISTGVSTKKDIYEAISACKRMGNKQIILLKCTSEYPTPPSNLNLKTIPDMNKRFKVEVGLSDHTLGITASIAAVCLGAKVIEKHIIIDRNIGGPDSTFSLNPHEFKKMVDSIREVEKALGKVSYSLTGKTKKSRKFSRSLFVVEDIKKGQVFNCTNVRSIRPADGLHPRYLVHVLGKKSSTFIKKGTPMKWKFISKH